MDTLKTVILLLTAALIMVNAAQKTGISYPIALVLGGAAIGFIPGLSAIHFDPNTFLTIVLPPILYQSAFWISFREFKRNWREIFSLALGLVVATTLVVAVVFKWLFPEIPWAMALAFGAIVSPPDAAAAGAILRRFPMDSRLLAVLEGESLVNDASALVLYRLALTALLSGMFSFGEASIAFTEVVLGGILVGVVTGIILQNFSKFVLDPVIGVIFSFTIPYITYILADSFGVSGVLAVVVNGLIGGRLLISHRSSIRRVFGFNSWDLVIIFLNCFVFIVIGSQLRDLTNLMTSSQIMRYSCYGLLITVVMLVVRVIWVYLKHSYYYFRFHGTKKFASYYKQLFRDDAIIAWSGMRGIVSLTAALAIPLTSPHGGEISGRNEVVFITFIVILLTLVIPGLTLPHFIRWLGVHTIHNDEHAQHIRKYLLDVAEKKIYQMHSQHAIDNEELIFLLSYFNSRVRILEISTSKDPELRKLELARRKVLHHQRKGLLDVWKQGKIGDKLLTQLERELDLEEAQSARAEIV